jgi:hypothetical protein
MLVAKPLMSDMAGFLPKSSFRRRAMATVPKILLFLAGFIASLSMSGPASAAGGEKLAGRANGKDGSGLACSVDLIEPHQEGEEEKSEELVRVRVRGRKIVLEHAAAPVESLRVYPADATSVLVAAAYTESATHEPRGSSFLWRVPCDSATPPVKVAHIEHADFGHSALAADGRMLFYTGVDGVFSLDLHSWKSRRVTRPTFPYCTESSVDARDVVIERTADGSLLLDRGCSYEWEWHSQSVLLRRPESAKPVIAPAPRPRLASVAIDAGGGIWLSDGQCDDRRTYNSVLHSTDHGEHWGRVPVKRDAKIPFVDQPVRQVIADNKNPKLLLVFTLSCDHGGQHTEPAWIYVTEDGGTTFRPVGVPPGIPNAANSQPGFESDPFYAVSAPQGSLSDLILFGQTTDETTGAGIGRWESHDRGRTWKPMASVRTRFEDLPKSALSATHADWKVTIEQDGLHLFQQGKHKRIHPPR